jgi:hypothetical protein
MVQRTTLAGGTVVLKGDRNVITIIQLAPGVLFLQPVGVTSPEVDRLIFEELERAIEKSGKIDVFVDSRGQPRISRETRDLAGEWSKGKNDKVKAHLLVNSRFIEMALAVISMVSGNPISTYSTEERFVTTIQKRVPTFRLPALPTVA